MEEYIIAIVSGNVDGYPIIGKKGKNDYIYNSYYLTGTTNYKEQYATEIQEDFPDLDSFLKWIEQNQ